MAPPTPPAGVPPPTTSAPPQRSAAQPPAPTPSNPAMEVCSAPPVARAVLHSSAPRPTPPAAPAFPMEETPSAPPPVTPAPFLQAPEGPVGPRPANPQHLEPPPAPPDLVAPRDPLPAQKTLGPAAPTPDVEMSIVEDTSASSTSAAWNATIIDLDAFIERHPSVSFAGTDALGLGREEVLNLLSSRTKAQRNGPLLSPPQGDALAGMIKQILDLRPGAGSNLYKVLGQVKTELRTIPAAVPTPPLPALRPSEPVPLTSHGKQLSPAFRTPPLPAPTEMEESVPITEEERCAPPPPAPRLAEPIPPVPHGDTTTPAMATPPPPLSTQLDRALTDKRWEALRDYIHELTRMQILPRRSTSLAAIPTSNAAAQVRRNWADITEEVNPGAEEGFTLVQGRKRRRGSVNSPTAAAPSSNTGGSRTIRRPQPSAGSVPRAQEIRVTRAHIAEARARQASSSEEHCVYIEHSPELEPFHYLKALDRMLGGTAGVIQITKVNGHQLLGFTNRGLAERLISEGLEVEGTLLRAFSFRKRTERITVGNLPFFVGDSAVIKALSPYGRVTSIAPKQMKAGPYVYVDGRRDIFITLHEGITIERLPTRLDINIKGEAWPAYLSSGIRCSRCHGQGHRRAFCPLLAGLANNTRMPPPTTPAGAPPPTTPAPPQRSAAQPPAPAPSNPTMEVCSAPPVAQAVLYPSAPRPSPPAAPALPMEETPSAPPPVTPAPSLQVPGGPAQRTLGSAAPAPDVEMSIVEETSASSTSSAKNATRVDLDAFIEKHPSVSFAGTDALGLGREEVLDLLSSRTKAQRKGPLLSPPQCDALAGLIGQIMDLRPGVASNLYKVLGQVKAELRTTPAVPPTPPLPAPRPAEPTPPAPQRRESAPAMAAPPPPPSAHAKDDPVPDRWKVLKPQKKACLEIEASRDNQALTSQPQKKACLEIEASRDNQASTSQPQKKACLEIEASRDNQALTSQPQKKACLEIEGSRDNQALTSQPQKIACLEIEASRDNQALTSQPQKKACLEIESSRDNQALTSQPQKKACLEIEASRDNQALTSQPQKIACLEIEASRDNQALTSQPQKKACLEIEGSRDNQALTSQPQKIACLEIEASRDNQALTSQPQKKACLEIEASRDNQALTSQPQKKACLEIEASRDNQALTSQPQ
ncbi:hypothetical protein LAZ67_3002358, partial [Cordylochernes scorpioides]